MKKIKITCKLLCPRLYTCTVLTIKSYPRYFLGSVVSTSLPGKKLKPPIYIHPNLHNTVCFENNAPNRCSLWKWLRWGANSDNEPVSVVKSSSPCVQFNYYESSATLFKQKERVVTPNLVCGSLPSSARSCLRIHSETISTDCKVKTVAIIHFNIFGTNLMP